MLNTVRTQKMPPTHAHTQMHTHIFISRSQQHSYVRKEVKFASERSGRYSPEVWLGPSNILPWELVRHAASVPGPHLLNQSLHFRQDPQVTHLHRKIKFEKLGLEWKQLSCTWGLRAWPWVFFFPGECWAGTNCSTGLTSRKSKWWSAGVCVAKNREREGERDLGGIISKFPR